MRGVSGDDPEGGAGSGVPRLRREPLPREARDPSASPCGLRTSRWRLRSFTPGGGGVGPRPKIAMVERRERSRSLRDRPRRKARRSRLARATKQKSALSALHPPLVRGKWDCWCRQITAGSPAEALAKGGCEEERQTRTPERVAGTKKTALFDIVRRDCGQRFASRAAGLSCPGRS
jgi:hypothetical protein